MLLNYTLKNGYNDRFHVVFLPKKSKYYFTPSLKMLQLLPLTQRINPKHGPWGSVPFPLVRQVTCYSPLPEDVQSK